MAKPVPELKAAIVKVVQEMNPPDSLAFTREACRGGWYDLMINILAGCVEIKMSDGGVDLARIPKGWIVEALREVVGPDPDKPVLAIVTPANASEFKPVPKRRGRARKFATGGNVYSLAERRQTAPA